MMCRQEENQFGKEEAMKNIVLDYVRGSIILITLSQKEFKYMSGDHAETLTECRCALQFVATYVQVAGFQETARASSGGEKKVPDWKKLLGGIGKDVGRIECSPHSFPFKSPHPGNYASRPELREGSSAKPPGERQGKGSVSPRGTPAKRVIPIYPGERGEEQEKSFKYIYAIGILWYMKDVVVPIRMSKALTRGLDDLVKAGLYSSRNEALKDSVRSLIETRRTMATQSREALQAELKAIANVAEALILEEGGPAISRVILFGSVARGEAREGSDIDLLVVLKGGDRHEWRRRLLGTLMPIVYRLGRYISLKTFTEGEVRELSEKGSPFIQEVVKTGIELYPKAGSSGSS